MASTCFDAASTSSASPFNNHNPRSCIRASCNATGSIRPSESSRHRTCAGNSTLRLRGNRSRSCIRAGRYRPTRARSSASTPSRPGNRSARARHRLAARPAPSRSSGNSRPSRACSRWKRQERSIAPWRCTLRLPCTARPCSGHSPPRRPPRMAWTNRTKHRHRTRRPRRNRQCPSLPMAQRPPARAAPRRRGDHRRRRRAPMRRSGATRRATSAQGVRQSSQCQGERQVERPRAKRRGAPKRRSEIFFRSTSRSCAEFPNRGPNRLRSAWRRPCCR